MQLIVEIQNTVADCLVVGNDGGGLYFVSWYHYKWKVMV